jgi:hypothetical protein
MRTRSPSQCDLAGKVNTRAIGVVCTGSESENIKDYDGPHTHLMRSLPRWMTPMP